MPIRLNSLVGTDKIQNKCSFRKRLAGLIGTKRKEFFLATIYAIGLYCVEVRVEPRPHWWKASTLTAVPTVLCSLNKNADAQTSKLNWVSTLLHNINLAYYYHHFVAHCGTFYGPKCINQISVWCKQPSPNSWRHWSVCCRFLTALVKEIFFIVFCCHFFSVFSQCPPKW